MISTELLLAISTGLAGLIAIFFTGARNVITAKMDRWRDQIMREKHALGLKDIAEFQSILDQMKPLANVDRVLLFTGKNGGGLPKAGKPYTVNCFFGWSMDPLKHPDQTYKFGLQVDACYIDMLVEVLLKGRSVQTTATMDKAAALREMYEGESVVQALLFLLQLDMNSNELTYMSVASYRRPFTPIEYQQINLMVLRMRYLMDRGIERD